MLVRPRGVQLEPISPGHEHVDLVYLAKPVDPLDPVLLEHRLLEGFTWFDRDAVDAAAELTPEVGAWARLALLELR
jgi:hypothetical protein